MDLKIERKVKLRDINEQIACGLCMGYLVDATTILECLHTFCKSCIVLYIQNDEKSCPKCGTVIHHSYPLQHISLDRTMQDIVEKIVPGLFEKERQRKIKFHLEKNLPLEQKYESNKQIKTQNFCDDKKQTNDNFHRDDEQVEILLQSKTSSLKPLKRPYLQCSVHTTIKTLKKFLAKCLQENIEDFSKFDILCNQEILGKDHTLLFILATRWRSKKLPLYLEYRPRISLL